MWTKYFSDYHQQRKGTTVPSFIIVGYGWHILGKWPSCYHTFPPSIYDPPQKGPSWIGLTDNIKLNGLPTKVPSKLKSIDENVDS